MKQIYAIRDVVAEAVGPLVLHAADPAAVRMFSDVAQQPDTQVARHVGDFELICLGQLYDDGTIVPAVGGPRLVITGKAWKAAQAPEESNVA